MQIYGPFRVSTQSSASVQNSDIQRAGEVGKASQVDSTSGPESTASSRAAGPVDELDLSQAATSANRLESSGPIAGEGIRFDRVAELRRQIAEGTYDTPEKMDAALEKMLDRWG